MVDEQPGYAWRGDVLLHAPEVGPVREVARAEEFPCLVRYRRYIGNRQARIHGEAPAPVKVEL